MLNINLFLPLWGRNDKLMFMIRFQKYTWKRFRWLSYMVHNYIYYHFCCEISPLAEISRDVVFPHPLGIVIGDGCVIQENVTIYQNVTLGQKVKNNVKGYPIIKKGSVIYPHSCVLGDIVVEEDTIIGAGSIITKSTTRGGVYCGKAAEKIK